jgi:hypothetical protein
MSSTTGNFISKLRSRLALVGFNQSVSSGSPGPPRPSRPSNQVNLQESTPSNPMSSWEQFWLEDYRVLFQSPTFLPTNQMTEVQRLNTLTRLILLIAIILAIFHLGNWLLFLLLGLGLVILLYYAQRSPATPSSGPVESRTEHYRCPRRPSAQSQLQQNLHRAGPLQQGIRKIRLRPKS